MIYLVLIMLVALAGCATAPTRPALADIRGPYYVASDELAWHCAGIGRWGCAIRSGATCWIYIERSLSATNRQIVLAHERGHCAGYTD